MQRNFLKYLFLFLVITTLLTPIWVFKDLLFPYVTSKAFFFRIAIELALPIYIYFLVLDKNFWPNLKNPLNLAVIFFLLLNLLASFTGVNVFRSLWGNFERMGGVFYFGHLVLLYFYIQLIGQFGENFIKRFLQAFIGIAVFVTLNGLLGWVGGPTLVMDTSLPGRVSSTFGNPIYFASFLIIPMFLSLFFALKEDKVWLRVLYWILGSIQLLGIYSSGTRGAIVGLFVGLVLGAILYFFLLEKKLYKYVGISILTVIVGISLLLVVFNKKLPEGSTLRRLSNMSDSNTKARLIQWKMALTGFKERPVLGVGPENYYVISNSYYNPKIYEYDSSWFDKPHNFLLEVLTTTGGLGFLVFVFISLLAFLSLWKAYKQSLIGRLELAILSMAFIAYQVQNIFVFDTVSASIAFYIFLGFCGYLWNESNVSEKVIKNENSQLALAVFVPCLLLMVYGQYLLNFSSLFSAKNTNYAYAYSDSNPKLSVELFNKAINAPFNLGKGETIGRFSDFSVKLPNSKAQNINTDFVKEQMDRIIKIQRQYAKKIQNDPIPWMQLAVAEMNQSLINGTDINVVKPTIDRALSLAPKRVELHILRMQLYGYTKNWPELLKTSKEIAGLNPYSANYKWQLAIAYYLNNDLDSAVKIGGEAIAQGFKFSQLQQFAWYIQFYQNKGDFEKTIPLLEQAINLEPNEIGLYVELVRAYYKVGNFQQAKSLAEMVIVLDPNQKVSMQEFIKMLEK